MGSGKESKPFPCYEKPRGRDSAHRHWRASGGLSHPPARSQHGGRALTAGGGAQNRVGSSRPLPPGAALGFRDLNPMSQDARLAAGSFVQRGALGGTTRARSQHGRRTASISGEAHNRVGLRPPLPPGATRGSRDSGAVCTPSRQRATAPQSNNAAISPKLNPFRRRCRWRIMHLTGKAVG